MEHTVTELSGAHRAALLRHFLALDAHDRWLRFGTPTGAAALRAYVGRIDFDRDVVFGTKEELVVAFEPREPGPTPDGGTLDVPWLSAEYDFVLQRRDA